MHKISMIHRLVLPGLIVLATICMAFLNYPYLPEQIPTHFDFYGTPDSWGRGSFSNFFSLPILQLALYLLFTWLITIFYRRPDIRDMINLPNRDKLSHDQLENIRSIIVNGMSWLNIFMCLMFFYIQLGTLKVVFGNWTRLGPVVWLFTVAIVGTSGWMLYRILKVRKQS